MKAAARQLLRALVRAEEWIFANPKIVLGLILAVTLAFATRLPGLRIYTDFSDLLPQKHPYIQTYNRIKENFGGANQTVPCSTRSARITRPKSSTHCVRR